MTDIRQLSELLHSGNYSCVIANGNETRTFSQRGVADLYDLLHNEPHFLRGATVADKVVGKGAAALMAMGGVARLPADVLSQPARELLLQEGVETSWDVLVPNIINRTGTDCCPLEKATREAHTLSDMRPIIENFVNNLRRQAANN